MTVKIFAARIKTHKASSKQAAGGDDLDDRRCLVVEPHTNHADTHNAHTDPPSHAAAASSPDTHQCYASPASQYQDEHQPAHQRQVGAGQFRLSKRRWAILVGLCTLGLQSGIVNEFNSILSVVVELIGLRLDKYIYLSQVFNYLSPVAALPSAWFVDRFGLRTTAYVCVAVGAVRAGSRALLFWRSGAHWAQLRLVYWLVGGAAQMQIVVLYYCLPLQVSEHWFPASERSLAWSLMVGAPNVGSALAALSVPHLVTSAEHVEVLMWTQLVSFALVLLVVLVCVTSSRPEHPASARGSLCLGVDGSLWRNVAGLAREAHLLLQLVAVNSFDALMAAVSSVLQDILDAFGLSPVFAGQLLAAMSLVSTLFLLAGSVRVHRGAERKCEPGQDASGQRKCEPRQGAERKASARSCKIYMALVCMSLLVYLLTLSMQQPAHRKAWLVVASALVYTSLRGWSAARYADSNAQLIAGCVTQASCAAGSRIVYSLLAASYAAVFVSLRREQPAPQPADYSDSLLFAGSAAVVATFAYMCCFRMRRGGPAADR